MQQEKLDWAVFFIVLREQMQEHFIVLVVGGIFGSAVQRKRTGFLEGAEASWSCREAMACGGLQVGYFVASALH